MYRIRSEFFVLAAWLRMAFTHMLFVRYFAVSWRLINNTISRHKGYVLGY